MKTFLVLIIFLLSLTTFNSCTISNNTEQEKTSLTQNVLTKEEGKKTLYLCLIIFSLIIFIATFALAVVPFDKINIYFIYMLFLIAIAILIIYTYKFNTFIGVGSSIVSLMFIGSLPDSEESNVNPDLEKESNIQGSIVFFTVFYLGFFVVTLMQYLFGKLIGLV